MTNLALGFQLMATLCANFTFLLVAKTNHINTLLKNTKTFWRRTSLPVPVNFIKAKNAFRKPFLSCNYKYIPSWSPPSWVG